MMRWAGSLAVAAVVGSLALVFLGCGGGPDRGRVADGHPPVVPVDLASIPDAVPRHEPLSRYGNPSEYEVFGQRYRTLASSAGYDERGLASWYGTKFHGRRTSSGEPYDMFAMTAAHRYLPLPSYVEVTNLDNGKRVVVRVNDRGPFAGGRIIDLSYAAAYRIGMVERGVAPVRVRALEPDDSPTEALQVAESEVETKVNANTSQSRNGSDLGVRFVQVGAYADREAADRVRTNLKALGFSEVQVTTFTNSPESSEPLHRVRIGPLQDVDAVQEVAERLHRAALVDYRVVVDYSP